MKKPRPPLRSRTLSSDGLAKAHGGRGTCHGYYECNYCHWQSWTLWDFCESCGRPYERINDPIGGFGSKK